MILEIVDGEIDTAPLLAYRDEIMRQKPYMQDGFQGTVREYRPTADNVIAINATCQHPACNRVLREQEGYYCDTSVSHVSNYGKSMTFHYYCIEHGEAGKTASLFN